MATNPKAGSASVQGTANTPVTLGDSGFRSVTAGKPFAEQDGPTQGLMDRLRVKGSAPQCDPRDPKGPK